MTDNRLRYMLEVDPEKGITGVKKFTGAFSEGMEKSKQSTLSLKGVLASIGAGYLAKKTTEFVVGMTAEAAKAEDALFGLKKATGPAFEEMTEKSYQLAEATRHIFSADEIQRTVTANAKSMERLGLTAEQTFELVARGADQAAIKGRNLEETSQALYNAIRGEAEAAESLGISLNDTFMKTVAFGGALEDVWEKMDPVEKAQWRYEEILRQTSHTVGAAAEKYDMLSGKVASMATQWDTWSAATGAAIATSPALLNLFDEINNAFNLGAQSADGQSAAIQSLIRDAILFMADAAATLTLALAGVSQGWDGIGQYANLAAIKVIDGIQLISKGVIQLYEWLSNIPGEVGENYAAAIPHIRATVDQLQRVKVRVAEVGDAMEKESQASQAGYAQIMNRIAQLRVRLGDLSKVKAKNAKEEKDQAKEKARLEKALAEQTRKVAKRKENDEKKAAAKRKKLHASFDKAYRKVMMSQTAFEIDQINRRYAEWEKNGENVVRLNEWREAEIARIKGEGVAKWDQSMEEMLGITEEAFAKMSDEAKNTLSQMAGDLGNIWQSVGSALGDYLVALADGGEVDWEEQAKRVGGAVGAVVGAAIGAYFGGPTGAQIGSTIGQALGEWFGGAIFEDPRSTGQKLLDRIAQLAVEYANVKGEASDSLGFISAMMQEIGDQASGIDELDERWKGLIGSVEATREAIKRYGAGSDEAREATAALAREAADYAVAAALQGEGAMEAARAAVELAKATNEQSRKTWEAIEALQYLFEELGKVDERTRGLAQNSANLRLAQTMLANAGLFTAEQFQRLVFLQQKLAAIEKDRTEILKKLATETDPDKIKALWEALNKLNADAKKYGDELHGLAKGMGETGDGAEKASESMNKTGHAADRNRNKIDRYGRSIKKAGADAGKAAGELDELWKSIEQMESRTIKIKFDTGHESGDAPRHHTGRLSHGRGESRAIIRRDEAIVPPERRHEYAQRVISESPPGAFGGDGFSSQDISVTVTAPLYLDGEEVAKAVIPVQLQLSREGVTVVDPKGVGSEMI